MSNSKQDNLDNIEIVLNELWNDLRETFTEIVERTILHREIHLDIVKDNINYLSKSPEKDSVVCKM